MEQQVETPQSVELDASGDPTQLTWLEDASRDIVRATRSWIQYGTLGFAAICIVIGAVEALFGR